MEFGTNANGEKFAKCLECKKTNESEKIIKMKNSNTSGVKRHIENCHSDAYAEIYGAPSSLKSKVKIK